MVSLSRWIKNFYLILPFLILLVLPLLVANLKEVKRFVTRAFFTRAHIAVNTRLPVANYHRGWLALAQGGEEPGKDMLQPALAPLSALKPEYIRLDHIFDDDYYGVIRTEAGQTVYDFSRLDQAVGTITAAGARPMLVLSYLPFALADSKIDAPRDWLAWQKLVGATIQHYSGRNGKNLDSVYYEVWNEPDLESFGSWKYYGAKNYLTLYHYAAMAAQSVRSAQPFKIGGPATTNFYPNWVKALVEYCRDNRLPLDFISYHQYSPFIEDYTDNARAIRRLLQDYPSYRTTEILLTEWGFDPSRNPAYNTNLAAAFQLAVTSAVGTAIDRAFTFEAVDGPDTNSWGIISHPANGLQTKPRYQALRWLSTLTSLLTTTGHGTYVNAIAGKNGETFILLMANYDPAGQHQENVPVRFFNLTPGRYRITTEFLGRNSRGEELTLDSSVYSTEVLMPPYATVRIQLQPLP